VVRAHQPVRPLDLARHQNLSCCRGSARGRGCVGGSARTRWWSSAWLWGWGVEGRWGGRCGLFGLCRRCGILRGGLLVGVWLVVCRLGRGLGRLGSRLVASVVGWVGPRAVVPGDLVRAPARRHRLVGRRPRLVFLGCGSRHRLWVDCLHFQGVDCWRLLGADRRWVRIRVADPTGLESLWARRVVGLGGGRGVRAARRLEGLQGVWWAALGFHLVRYWRRPASPPAVRLFLRLRLRWLSPGAVRVGGGSA
jgi:hypothetical protein